jgi:beta-barrel assembly-enhancing protease
MTLARFPFDRRGTLTKAIAFALAAVLAAAGPLACASTSVAPVGEAGAPFALERDEARLWKEAQEEEKQLRAKVPIYDDPLLDAYLNGLAQKLVPEAVKSQGVLKIRVQVIRDPALNAFTYPTGTVYVHTGLLARVENESQLAIVLGHEITHATNRHALEFQRSARNKMIGFSIASLVGSIVVAESAGRKAERGDWTGAYVLSQVGNILVGLGLNLAFLAAVNGFGRDLEREADEVGLQRAYDAGYDPREGPRLLALLKDDHGDDSKMEVFFFGNHPRLDERIESTQALVAARFGGAGGGGRVTDTREFQMRTRTLVRDDAGQNLEAGRLGTAEAEIKKVLALTPNDPVAHVLYGQLDEKRAAETKDPAEARGLLDGALLKYEEAARLDDHYADPHKAIGLLRYKAGEKDKARDAFRRYLELRPDAPDARQIKDYILEIEAR